LRITPLVATESELSVTSTARAAARAHAQKNCAAVILAIARLATPDLPPQHRERFERLRDAASRLVRLFNEELREALPQDVDVEQVFGTACDLVRDRAEADGVALVASCAGGRLCGDAEALTEALVNLIGNAIDASPAGDRVRVDARIEPTGGQRWTIEDAGQGMPADVLDGIGGVVRSGRPLGSGFGIALAATTIQAHGGTLRFEARMPQGTRVVIDLPPASAATAGSERSA
jgi:signal transduction histidine kinase